MITNISARGFKGLNFSQRLTEKNLLTGRVGSGKSARALALALLVTGSLPASIGVAKTNADIFRAVASGEEMSVSATIDKQRFERIFKTKKDGITCLYRFNGEPVQKNLFALELDKLGVHLVDVQNFLALSDAKQIDELFRLFPPDGDIKRINADIASTKEAVATLNADIKAKQQSRESITQSLATMALPPTTLPQVQADIERLENDLTAVREDIVREQVRLENVQKDGISMHPPAQQQGSLTSCASVEQADQPVLKQAPHTMAPSIAPLEAILSTLDRAGCTACAARLVALREIKKIQGLCNVINA